MFRSRHRRTAITALLVLLAVAGFGITACDETPAPPTATATHATTTQPPRTLLLSVGEINTVYGTTDFAITQTGEAPDDVVIVSPPECHAISYTAGEQEYGHSGFVAMRWQVLENPRDRAIQSVTQFKSPESANKFVADLTQVWESCRGKTYSVKDKQSGSDEGSFGVDAVTPGSNVVSETDHRLGGSGDSCQHILRSTSSFVIETSTCGYDTTEQATRIVSMIALKIYGS